MKTINQLASKIAKLEGKKSQARICDIREILSILSDLIYDQHCHTSAMLYCGGKNLIEEVLCENGRNRDEKKVKMESDYDKYVRAMPTSKALAKKRGKK